MIVLAMPTMGTVPIKVVGCIVATMMSRDDIIPYFVEGSLVYNARQACMKYALEKDADLLFIDSDIMYPVEGIQRLIDHNADIVSGLYWDRRGENKPIAWDKVRVNIFGKTRLERTVNIVPYSEVEGVGMGFCLIKNHVLRVMAKVYRESFRPMRGLGEDFSFLVRARRLGFKCYLDSTFELKHLGEYAYTFRDVQNLASLPPKRG